MIKLELTAEEAEVLENYIFRKLIRLEESDLKDSKCYMALYPVYHKLHNAEKK